MQARVMTVATPTRRNATKKRGLRLVLRLNDADGESGGQDRFPDVSTSPVNLPGSSEIYVPDAFSPPSWSSMYVWGASSGVARGGETPKAASLFISTSFAILTQWCSVEATTAGRGLFETSGTGKRCSGWSSWPALRGSTAWWYWFSS